jgi:hypothetical protein
MATLEDYQTPKFTRYDEGHTLGRDDSLRYMSFSNTRSYRNGQPQPGYNAQNPSLVANRVRFDTDVVNLKPLLSAQYL